MLLPPLPSVAQLLSAYGVRALKQLSQNFILDKNVTERFVRCAGNLRDKTVIEIGGGPGTLTRAILQGMPRKLIVIEKDRRMLPLLEMVADCAEDRMTVLHADALDLDYAQLLADHGVVPQAWTYETVQDPQTKVIANLPFSVASPIFVKFLDMICERKGACAHGPLSMALAFQLEVCQRLSAPPGARPRSRASIIAQALCDVHMAYKLPSHFFVPAPKVDAGVVTFVPRLVGQRPTVDDVFGAALVPTSQAASGQAHVGTAHQPEHTICEPASGSVSDSVEECGFDQSSAAIPPEQTAPEQTAAARGTDVPNAVKAHGLDFDTLEHFATKVFRSKRKLLTNNMKYLFADPRQVQSADMAAVLQEVGISCQIRPADMRTDDVLRLCNHIASRFSPDELAPRKNKRRNADPGL